MKKIGVYFNKFKYNKEKIKEFCENECFEFIDIDSIDKLNNADHSWIMIMTDEFDENLSNLKIGVPLVLVGDLTKCGSTTSCYQLSKDFNDVCLRGLVDVIYHGGILETFNIAAKPTFIKKECIIHNDIFNIDKIVYNLTRELIYFFKISDIQKLRIGISEILTNAIEHGNLEISGDKKFEETENGTYLEFLKQRLLDDRFKDRYVSLMMEINSEIFKVVIKDMGQGFDTKSISNQFDDDDLLKLHGRGILIAKMYFDEIVYNEKGNKATLIKRIKEC
ncbi:ATP-binding protein [Deferribacter autotrophicus]|uniref:ATP-binding protein n=1 Tax=Deferribacter autotrophicus TaxID=500465 RepID=A0A5A8F2D4_9BACT|nr:ATP-binding protein [Deferribacter autotrophicus]KAA0257963.1 ATP-binding protein [Deferribacter autotrophicus]